MDIKTVTLPINKITDWNSFHSVFKETFGFPEFYGSNMNAWNDCMTYLDDPDSDMSRIKVARDEFVIIKVEDADDFKNRCPKQYEALIQCTAFVNYRRVNVCEAPILALMMIGFY